MLQSITNASQQSDDFITNLLVSYDKVYNQHYYTIHSTCVCIHVYVHVHVYLPCNNVSIFFIILYLLLHNTVIYMYITVE